MGVVLEAEGVAGVKWINPEAIILPINDLIKNLDRLKMHSSLEKSQINLRPVACIRGRKIIIKVLKLFKIKKQEIHLAQTAKTGVQTRKNPLIKGSQKDTPTPDKELETAIINDIKVRGRRPT